MLYGNTLPNTMERCFEAPDCFPKDNSRKILVHRLTYMRGLDGQLPGTQETGDRKDSKGDGEANKQASLTDVFKTKPGVKDEDRPNGQGQQDYLRRLADRLRTFDETLHRQNEGGISAIGILGSDVFDKLLVLRALQPKFPAAVFFTTDLDASLTLPSELDFTRNLIISSSFGPELREDIQGEIPPFRGSYQTSAFLATSLAIDTRGAGWEPASWQEKISAWLSQSRIFEIGRTGDLIQYSARTKDVPTASPRNRQRENPASIAQNISSVEGRSAASYTGTLVDIRSRVSRPDSACGDDIRACRDIQPPIDKLFPEPENLDLIAGTFAGTGLLIVLTLFIRRLHEHAGVEISILALITGAAAAACYNWESLATWLTEDGRGEPMALLQGVSVWPTILPRALSVVLSIYLLWRAWRKLDENLYEIAQQLNLPKPNLAIAAERKHQRAKTYG
jgi:hypothetical protein